MPHLRQFFSIRDEVHFVQGWQSPPSRIHNIGNYTLEGFIYFLKKYVATQVVEYNTGWLATIIKSQTMEEKSRKNRELIHYLHLFIYAISGRQLYHHNTQGNVIVYS